MPNAPHQDEAQDSVKARAKIKLERDLGPVLAGLKKRGKSVKKYGAE
jgi:hypothetical protein